jgi:NAD(P)-dependent dehydrogenase (short-subunit alcohol dehydrogenase family)
MLLQGTGIARILSQPSNGNLAVALLARRSDALDDVVSTVRKTSPDAVLETFPTDTSKASLEKVFKDIKAHQSFKGLKLQMAIYSIKHSSKKPFLEETYEDFNESLEAYVGGAFVFAQESLKLFFSDHGETSLAEGAPKKGVGFLFAVVKVVVNNCRRLFSLEPWARSGAVPNSPHMELDVLRSVNSRKHWHAK